jgi:high-affinity Fe2+/Pb2+ permease
MSTRDWIELSLQILVCLLIGGGFAGRFYFLNKAHKAKLELNQRLWDEHDAQIARMRKGERFEYRNPFKR